MLMLYRFVSNEVQKVSHGRLKCLTRLVPPSRLFVVVGFEREFLPFKNRASYKVESSQWECPSSLLCPKSQIHLHYYTNQAAFVGNMNFMMEIPAAYVLTLWGLIMIFPVPFEILKKRTLSSLEIGQKKWQTARSSWTKSKVIKIYQFLLTKSFAAKPRKIAENWENTLWFICMRMQLGNSFSPFTR